MEHQFRNAMFGGFNRQDVLDYLESIANENNQKLESLQKQLETAQNQCGQLSGLDEEHTSQLDSLKQENEQFRQENAQLTGRADAAEAEAKSLREQLDAARSECESLRAQVEKFRPGAEAYDAVKDRAAGVELDAHRRAQCVLNEAQEDAQHIHSQVEQWLGQVEREYSDLRSQIDATVSHTSGELDKVSDMLAQITQQLVDQDSAFEQLETACAKKPPVKVPAPMPIPEE